MFALLCSPDSPSDLVHLNIFVVSVLPRERPGLSAFVLEGGVVYHTYSTYARGLDGLWGTRKADLFVALLQASHGRAKKTRRKGGAETFDDVIRDLGALMFDRQRMRFFLGIVLETSEEDDLRPILEEHARGLAERIAVQFGRSGDAPAIIAFIDSLRGMGLRKLLEGRAAIQRKIEKLAQFFGWNGRRVIDRRMPGRLLQVAKAGDLTLEMA